MTEINNDKLLRDFFAENKQEIADNGFSRRVMHHLECLRNDCCSRTFCMVRRIGSSLGNNKRSIYRHD